jgi:hypothetical protein
MDASGQRIERDTGTGRVQALQAIHPSKPSELKGGPKEASRKGPKIPECVLSLAVSNLPLLSCETRGAGRFLELFWSQAQDRRRGQSSEMSFRAEKIDNIKSADTSCLYES